MTREFIFSPFVEKSIGINFELSFKILILKETGNESTKVRPIIVRHNFIPKLFVEYF
jgi:hypothetical protein